MLRLFFTLCFVAIVIILNAQSYKGVKVYAYRQPVISGVNPVGVIDESGKEVTVKSRQRSNNRIYISFPPQAALQTFEVYVNGIKHKVNVSNIAKTPVKFSSSNILDKTEKELVPKTTNKVLLLTPTQSVAAQPNSCVKKLMAKNNLVVAYTIKGKKYYTAVKEFTMLEPAVMQ